MKYSAVTLLRKFLFNIDEFWEGNRRQAEKSRKRLDAITNFYSHDRDQCLGFLSRIADERLNSNRRTLYLPSFGASGSHLVQHIVATSTNAITLGEVYMPPMAERHALELDGQERVKFMEMYHLASTSTPWMIPSRGTIVNTAHKAKLQFFSENTAKFSSVLIMRDPCDIAISRTYRKGEYRSYLGKDSISDDDYLSENIALGSVPINLTCIPACSLIYACHDPEKHKVLLAEHAADAAHPALLSQGARARPVRRLQGAERHHLRQALRSSLARCSRSLWPLQDPVQPVRPLVPDGRLRQDISGTGAARRSR